MRTKEESRAIARAIAEKWWNERKLSANWTPEDERELANLIMGAMAQDDAARLQRLWDHDHVKLQLARAQNQDLRAALRQLREAFLRLNNGCYPLPGPDATRWRREAMEMADRMLDDTPQ